MSEEMKKAIEAVRHAIHLAKYDAFDDLNTEQVEAIEKNFDELVAIVEKETI